MRVLLTGATGFVGRQIMRGLEEKGVGVKCIIRKGTSQRLEYTDTLEQCIETKDLFNENYTFLTNLCKDTDIVIHAAWYAEPGKYLQSEKNLHCLKGTIDLAEAAINSGVKKLVGIGTCFEYDLSFPLLKIDTPLKPNTLYASSKASAFFLLSTICEKSGCAFNWCRLFYLYGDGEDKRRFVPYLLSKLESREIAELTSGNQIRDFLDVYVAGKMIVSTALGDYSGPVNICSGIPITIKQFAENIADRYNGRDLLRFGVRPDNLIDPPCVVGVK